MTREEAIEFVFNCKLHPSLKAEYQGTVDAVWINRKAVTDFIGKLYDDIESRVCENCKYYDSEEDLFKNEYMSCKLFYIETAAISNVKNFGCNKFERKQND